MRPARYHFPRTPPSQLRTHWYPPVRSQMKRSPAAASGPSMTATPARSSSSSRSRTARLRTWPPACTSTRMASAPSCAASLPGPRRVARLHLEDLLQPAYGLRLGVPPEGSLLGAPPPSSTADHRPHVEQGEAEELPHHVRDPLHAHRVHRPDRVSTPASRSSTPCRSCATSAIATASGTTTCFIWMMIISAFMEPDDRREIGGISYAKACRERSLIEAAGIGPLMSP